MDTWILFAAAPGRTWRAYSGGPPPRAPPFFFLSPAAALARKVRKGEGKRAGEKRRRERVWGEKRREEGGEKGRKRRRRRRGKKEKEEKKKRLRSSVYDKLNDTSGISGIFPARFGQKASMRSTWGGTLCSHSASAPTSWSACWRSSASERSTGLARQGVCSGG